MSEQNVSEQKAEETSSEPGSVGFGPAVPSASEAKSEPVAASAQETVREASTIESPDLVPGQDVVPETSGMDAPKFEAGKLDVPKADVAKADVAKADAPETDAPVAPGKIMIMSSGDRAWDSDRAGPDAESGQNSGMFGKRRLAALAAVVALAAIAGAIGGAAATVGLQRLTGTDAAVAAAAPAGNPELEATVARVDSDIQALKNGIEHASKTSVGRRWLFQCRGCGASGNHGHRGVHAAQE